MADPDPRQNGLLASLPTRVLEAIRPAFQSTELVARQTLMEAGQRFTRLHFPCEGTVSSVAVTETGASVEMSSVGREGLLEIEAVVDSETAVSRQVVQIPGFALTLGFGEFRRLAAELPEFRDGLRRYAQAYLFQALRCAACNAAHTAPERTARWLLRCDDRSGGEPFALTQESLAELLGVSRPAINTVARAFQQSGLIRYNRGQISVINRVGLEHQSCECYALIRDAFEIRNIVMRPS